MIPFVFKNLNLKSPEAKKFSWVREKTKEREEEHQKFHKMVPVKVKLNCLWRQLAAGTLISLNV